MKKLIPILLMFLFLTACKKDTYNVLWEEISSMTELDLHAIHFINADTGYIIGGARYSESLILRTQDGGTTWEELSLDLDKGLYDICFVNNQKGYIAAYDGNIAHTSDGGDTWTLQALGVPYEAYLPLRSITFSDENNGIAVGGVGYEVGLIAETSNGGTSWDTTYVNSEMRKVVYTEGELYMCGFGEVHRKANDATWELLDVDDDYFTSMSFINDQEGLVVGYWGSVYHTDDSGNTWNCLRNSSYARNRWHINDVWMVDDAVAYIAGEGFIKKSTNGGEDWTPLNLKEGNYNQLHLFDENSGIAVGDDGLIVKFSK